MRRSRFAPVVAMLVALLALGACGDDTTSDSSSTGVDGADAATTTTAGSETSAPATTATPEPTEVTITHYSGTDTVPYKPETIVVMDTGVLLTLDALGITADGFGSLGVPVPDAYESITNSPDLEMVGTAFEPDYEAINALEPDLIIVATRSSATYPEMSKIAPTIDLTLFEDVDYLDAFRARHIAIGEIFGIQDLVDEKLAALDAEIARIGDLTADAGDALIVLTSGTEVSAYGPGSRFGLVHDVLGYGAADLSLERDATHGDVVSFEFISEAAPDVLFVVDRGAAIGEDGELARQVLDNELVTGTPAWTNDRVVYVDGFSWYIAGDSLPAMEAIIADVESSLG